VGLELSTASQEGKRLGQISGARNLSAILGSFIVYLGFSQFKFSYGTLYVIAFIFALLAAYNFSRMKLQPLAAKPTVKFLYRKEYNLFYMLNILAGARKQIFLTFGPWVLISVFGTKPETIAVLIIIASTLGVFFRQAFGELTDKFGEGKMMKADAIILLVICLGYAFSVNRYFLYSLYIIDNLMFATRIARTTYLNKIAKDKTDLAPTISLGVTIDHVFSMTTPLLGGLLWVKFGYSSVFLATISVAILTYLVAAKMKLKEV
jgi:predicted MFS family arabinose efflux permease